MHLLEAYHSEFTTVQYYLVGKCLSLLGRGKWINTYRPVL